MRLQIQPQCFKIGECAFGRNKPPLNQGAGRIVNENEQGAGVSTSGLKGLILPPAPVGEVVILYADNDVAGISAAEQTAARLESEGRVVSIILPKKAGDDFNDVLRDK